ncbi:MAG: signal peptide peptidase SppA, partial [Verrucomicrobia bacterium]|nr:signal peptide peptidase SppA [Verrucomicrobiota bacterium]
MPGDNDTYKAIVLRVNSPGGSVSGSEAVLFELIRAREAGLPVVVSMGPVAASGGYWIATASDKIIAGPQTITGSIGVFGILPNLESLGSSYGLNWDRVRTNQSSDIFSIARPKTDQEISIIQEYVNQTYERFLSLVGESRKLALAEVENLAEGRVWTGKEAYDLGLVDDLGGL